MRALCWHGVNDLRVDDVPDPSIVNPRDVILRVRLTTTCGSDLHLIDGYVPTMEEGDVLGHEFMGEIVAAGAEVRNVRVGQRVVVPSFIGCGSCWWCQHEQYSLCDNTNPNWAMQEPLLGFPTGGIYGYTHAFGGYAGSHAEYVRVPHADTNCFGIPDAVDDLAALFLSDAAPTGFMGADFCAITPGDTVAVWGCGGVGLMAQQSALLLGAGRVIAIDPLPERRQLASRFASDTLDPEEVDVVEALVDLTGGRGPDACIEAVGMEAGGGGLQHAYDRAKQALRLHTDRGQSLRQAILACRKGGTLSMLGVFGVMDTFPLGALMNKGLTLRTAQQHGQRYVPRLLAEVAAGRFETSFLATHPMALDDAVDGYDMFKHKRDGCVRCVFTP